MQINKQNLNIGKAIFEGEIKSCTEGSIIVPDVKPDILKILQVDAEAFLNEKNIEDGKLILSGKVCVNVLYIPESDSNYVQCIKASFDFCETLKKTEFEKEMNVTAFCDVQRVGYKLINSRKVSFDAQVLININVSSEEQVTFICGIEEQTAELMTDRICIKEAPLVKNFRFNLEESVDLPTADCIEILKSSIVIIEKDCRLITGKAIIKAKASVSVLYMTDKGCYEHFDFELPFTEVTDIDDATEECDCELLLEVSDSDFVLCNSEDADKKNISVSININASVICDKCIETEYIKDCYFTDFDCSMEYDEIICNDIIEKPAFSALLKQVIEKSEKAPEISKVYTSIAKPYINSTDIQNGRIAVSGKVTVYILYISDNPQNPLACISEDIPFSYMIDSPKATRESDVLINIECEHISCTLNSTNSIEIRCGLGIKGKVVKKSRINIIKDIVLEEEKKKDNSMIIYFIKENDTLWNIGKNYHVKCEKICEYNHINTEEELTPGGKLVIPV